MRKGSKHTEVAKRLNSLNNRGRIPWNKKEPIEAKEILCACGCGGTLLNMSKEGREKKFIHGHNKPNTGNKHSQETKDKISKKKKGRPLTEEHKRKVRENNGQRGEKNINWKGGITSTNEKIRKSLEYKLWAKAVKERDNYTCQICGQRGGYLESDHIKPFCEFVELRFDLDNGRTLCADCHYNHGWNIFKNRNPRKKGAKSTRHKSVYCLNTNKVYGSYKEAALKTGISRSSIHNIVSRGKILQNGFTFQLINEELLIF